MSYASNTETVQAHWQSVGALDQEGLPASMYSLITESGSLTERLRASCREGFGVQLLRQARCRPEDFPEHVLSDVCAGALVREVFLKCDGRPVVFAQTLLPDTTLAAHPWLAELGDQPLGQALFAREDVRRLPFEFAKLGHDHSLVARAIAQMDTAQGPASKVWARRSQFMVAGLPVSVNEVFFRAVPAHGE